jgi:WD40 repeat protein
MAMSTVSTASRLRAASRGLNTLEEASKTALLIGQLPLWKSSSDPPSSFSEIAAELPAVLDILTQLREELIANATAKDTFRRAAGFERLIELFSAHSKIAVQHGGGSQESAASEQENNLAFVTALLRLLFATLDTHQGNRKYFGVRLNGWRAVRECVVNAQSALTEGLTQTKSPNIVVLYDSLLSLAFLDESITFEYCVRGIRYDIPADPSDPPTIFSALPGTPLKVMIKIPEVFSTLFHLALQLQGQPSASDVDETSSPAFELIKFIQTVSGGPPEANLLTDALPLLFNESTSTKLKRLLRSICFDLGAYGFQNLDDAAVLFRQASKSDAARDLLRDLLLNSRWPGYFEFDLRLRGFASIEFPSLPRVFPSETGYSLVAWMRFDQFDRNCHTTIFGAYDHDQKCFVLIYLEKDSFQLILQTSVRSAAIPSIRFKTAKFELHRWYHVALIHRRNASHPDQSMASLFINGDFMEQRKCSYPESPALQPERLGPPQAGAPHRRLNPVQAFFGTPSGIATSNVPGAVQSRWSLAGAHLYQTPLTDEIIAVYCRLGPRYRGNFQDCLGPLLTYRASAELQRYNELLHPDKSDKSDIITATEQRGSNVAPESRLLLGIDPDTTINFESPNYWSSLVESAADSKALAKYQALAQKARIIALNTAIPAAVEAVGRSYGTGVLTGGVFVVQPHHLDNLSWSLIGSLPVLFQQVETANTCKALLKAIEIVLECVKDNWRISEAMEKGHGYGLLAVIIREKLGIEGNSSHPSGRHTAASLSPEDRQALELPLLTSILKFTGYDMNEPAKSMLVNPMAYRVLLLDFDTWRRCDIPTQELYWSQFRHFVVDNRHLHFNQKRLSRMRVLKKFMEALKSEDFSEDSAALMMPTLKTLLESNTAHTLYRDFAMFITYGLHDERAMPVGQPRGMAQVVSMRQRISAWPRGPRSPRPATPGSAASIPIPSKPSMTRFELAVLCLRLVVEIVSDERSSNNMRRFNKAVPNRWLLHLLAETDTRVINLAVQIVCRALVALGPEFKDPFAGKNVGFVTLKTRLKSFWRSQELWATSFAILFGRNIPQRFAPEEFGAFHLVEVLTIDDATEVVQPEMLSPIFAMLEAGLRHVALTDDDDDKSNPAEAGIIAAIIQFLNEVYNRSSAFREFAISSRYTQELLFILFPLLTGSDRLAAETELASEKDALSFKGEEVKMRPHSNSIGERPPSVRSLSSVSIKRVPSPLTANRVEAPKRVSSFVLINSSGDRLAVPPAQFTSPMTPKGTDPIRINVTNSLVEALLELAISIFIDHICNKDKFAGVGLFQKVPPGFQEHQAYFESYVLVNALAQLGSHLRLNQRLLTDTRVLTNLARYTQHMAEAVSEGWFIDGAQPLLDFAGELLEHLQLPNIAQTKSVRLCSQSVNSIRIVFLKATLWRLSELNEDAQEKDVTDFLVKMMYWQTILFSSENQETLFTKLICYLLYHKLVSKVRTVRLAAASLWRTVLVQKPTEAATLLTNAMGPDQRHLSTGFMRLVSSDDDEFLNWIDANRRTLDNVFHNYLSRPWDDFVQSENRSAEESSKNRLSKRREKLRQWMAEETSTDDLIFRFENSTSYWRSNVHSQERTRLQRAIQDHQESMNQLSTSFEKLEKEIRKPAGLEPLTTAPRWQLDETEAVNRMRMRVLPDYSEHKEVFQSKRKYSERRPASRLAIDTQVPKLLADDVLTPMPITPATPNSAVDQPEAMRPRSDSVSNSQLLEGGFEMVDDPKEDEDGLIEDKNRKVMTSLQRGDAVKHLFNISRIVGLEACEGLLVIGEKCLYIQDNFFQRSDGEIIGVAQAPEDERDPYVHQISGKDVGGSRSKRSLGEQEIRCWAWAELLSISKRRFLLRDVAVEVFFTDGRSYLLTCMATKGRDDLYSYIVSRAPHVHSTTASTGEDSWRLDTLRTPESEPQSFGSKFGNLFNSGPTHAATKKWMKGEMSNFQYLMLVNTMAGRTFNDLTQYPVFPWVLADYTSEELDLDNPRVYRDFSKPMGCQSPLREAEYKDRFKQFAEMGDHNAPPFHYGTHYSSAMIVSSYLIRLQPFVQSYLLLQGGTFDHADRLFDSIEKTWISASQENRSDVRELTPEFFYLPEFLTNMNNYDFGSKQGSGESVNHIQLPRWAKGDPHIFIAKHREALESPYVSEHLHQWIDLVFGFKQRGEAAIEATNCFHHLSYGGAKDLDKIDDPVERLATIGIIHSFGQTPHQVFTRPHPAREYDRHADPRLDSLIETLIRVPNVLIQTGERVADLTFSRTEKTLLACGPLRRNVPPAFDRFVQWGFTDNSLRFFALSSGRLLGLYENTHVGPITTTTFVDSKTLLTAGMDCTIGVWTLSSVTRNSVEISPKTYLFGHRSPVIILAASRVFSTLISVSTDGQALLWGLNRYNCIRVLLPTRQDDNNSGTTTPSMPTITAARISNVTGHILLAAGPDLLLYTLNGHLLVRQQIAERPADTITAIAFYEGAPDHSNAYLRRELIFSGHPGGVTNVWQLESLGDGEWRLVLVKRMAGGTDVGRAIVSATSTTTADHAPLGKAAVTCILPAARAVYVGDEDGNVWDWECVQRGGAGR